MSDPKPAVVVTVKARPNSFKTSIAVLIADTLRKAGIEVEMDGGIRHPAFGDRHAEVIQEHSPEALERIRVQMTTPGSERLQACVNKTRVIIRQEQRARGEEV